MVRAATASRQVIAPARRAALTLALLATPTLAAAHSGIVVARTAPEWSDLALAIFAVVAVWFVRRALRARFRRDRSEG